MQPLEQILALALIYYWPTWFQAVKGASPVESAVDFFTVAFIVAPFAIVAGLTVKITQRYYVVNIVAWVLVTAGPGLLSLINFNSSRSAYLGLPLIYAAGVGLLFTATTFAVLAPLPPSLSGHAMSFFVFIRSLGQLIGIVLGSVVLNNELAARLPEEFLAMVPGGLTGAYSAIPLIATL
jgi:hypothetical protein